MTRDEHIQRHLELHRSLDELVADFIIHNNESLSNTSILDLIYWSFKQTTNPSDETHGDEVVDA